MTDAEYPCDKGQEGLFYLWHLQALRLVSNSDGKAKKVWKDVLENTQTSNTATVAIIDNGCAGCATTAGSDAYNPFEHPNLSSKRLVNPVDFTGFYEGAVYAGRGSDWPAMTKLEEMIKCDKELQEAFEAVHGPLKEVLDRIRQGCQKTKKYWELPDPSDRFAAHGTACAGLVAANAADFAKRERDDDTATKFAAERDRNPNAIGYSGIHPMAKIIPISTVYNTEYWPLIMALLWSLAHGADVILIPRGVSDLPATRLDNGKCRPPTEDELREDLSLRGTRLLSGNTRSQEKRLFDTLLSLISERIPVVIAAGNSGTDSLDYPANLVLMGRDDGDPVAEHLIVVGAVNARGAHSSYSAGYSVRENLFYAPSDDTQEVSDTYTRHDPIAWRGRNMKMPRYAADRGPFSPYGVMAIDIPGQYGYATETGDEDDFAERGADLGPIQNKSDKREPYDTEVMPRALYTVFGGTSAASCQIAGLLALLQQKQRNDGKPLMSGREAKKALKRSWVHAPDMEYEKPDAGYGMQIVSGKKLLGRSAGSKD